MLIVAAAAIVGLTEIGGSLPLPQDSDVLRSREESPATFPTVKTSAPVLEQVITALCHQGSCLAGRCAAMHGAGDKPPETSRAIRNAAASDSCNFCSGAVFWA